MNKSEEGMCPVLGDRELFNLLAYDHMGKLNIKSMETAVAYYPELVRFIPES